MVKANNCRTERHGNEWVVVDSDGTVVSRFAVSHGKRTQSNEVKAIYVRKFLKRIKQLRSVT